MLRNIENEKGKEGEERRKKKEEEKERKTKIGQGETEEMDEFPVAWEVVEPDPAQSVEC